MDSDLTTADTKQRILNTFKYYTKGPSVPSDGNCGLHAICKALGDGLNTTGRNTKPNTLMLDIFYMFGLENLPNYWWSDEELAVIANDFGYDMYIYNERDRTGIVFGKGVRPPLVLYSVNNNSHWIPGMRTAVPSSSIPKNFTIIENISEVLSIRQIRIKIRGHLMMQSLNSGGECIESYGGRRNRSQSSSIGRRVVSNIRNGRRAISSSRRHDGSHSRGRDGARIIVKQDGRFPQLEKSYGKEIKESHSVEKKESRREREKIVSRKSDEQLLIPYSPTVNDDRIYDMDVVKQKFNLYTKLKNTVLSKMIRQLYHWNRNKTNKYKKLDSFDTEDKGEKSEDTEFNAIYNARYTIVRDMLHYFVSKDERELLMLGACEAPQSLEPTMFQLEPIKYPKLEPVEAECYIEDANCCQIATVEYCTTVDCCSFEGIDYYSDTAVDYPYITFDYPYITFDYPYITFDYPYITFDYPFTFTKCPYRVEDCPFITSVYSSNDRWANNKHDNNLFLNYNLKQNKIKGTRLFDRFYNQAVKAMSNNDMVRSIVKPKRMVKALPTMASVLVAPAVAASAVTSPAIADWIMVAPGLSHSVMQVAQVVATPAMVDLMMVVPKVATPITTMPVEVAPWENDLAMVPVDNDLLAMVNNVTSTLVGNNSVGKPNICVKAYFSLKKIWKKKTKTQHSNDH